jgi:hypothetical protein
MVEASHVFAKLLDVWHTCTFRHGKYNHIEGYVFDSYNEMQTEMESTVLDKPKCVQWKWVWYLGLYGLRQEFDKREDVMECYTQEPWLKDRGVIDSATRAKRVSVLHQNDSGLFDRHLQEKRLKKQTG